MSASLLLALACAPARAPDEPSDDAPSSLDPYEFPDYGGCTRRSAGDSDVDGVEDHFVETRYDAEERAVEEEWFILDYATSTGTVEYDDAGCAVELDYVADYDEAFGDGYDVAMSWTQRCDAQVHPVSRTGETNGDAWTIDYVNRYDGDDLVRVEATQTWDGVEEAWTYLWEYGWADRLLVSEAYTRNGEPVSLQTWDRDDDGNLVLTEYTDHADPDAGWTQTWGYDAHGRAVTTEYGTVGQGELWSAESEWYEEIYVERAILWTYASYGGLELVEDWDCTLTWPWTCERTLDGEPWEEVPPDGEPDSTGTLEWTCD